MDRKVHYRHFMLLCFNSGKNASKMHDELCSVYGENTVSLRVCYKWFSKFRSGNFSIKDAPRSGRPTVIENDQVKQIVDQNPQFTTRQIADIVNVSKATIARRLKEIGYVSKLDVWVPHQLTETQLNQRITTCDLLLKRQKTTLFLKNPIIGDEKWIVYNNIKRKISWGYPSEPPKAIPKAGLHPKRFCFQFGGIGRVSSTLNSFLPTQRLARMFIEINWKN